jgi:predicted DsbA family dithiol-disulfide isomerase
VNANNPVVVTVDVVSDVVCPWCFIGKRRLASALGLRPGMTTEVSWRPFQLDATIPAGGIPRRDYLARKFGSDERIAALYGRIADAGRSEGIDFRFDRIERQPNTLDAHRLIRWAYAAGVQDVLVERLFALFFLEGRDIGDHDVLAQAAQEAGLDGDDIRHNLSCGIDRQAVQEEIASATKLGIAGVPCFIFDARVGVSGAQPPQVLAEAIDKALGGRGQAAAGGA